MFDEIGIMQGRLLPKFKGRYQAHPLGYWHNEFLIAKDIGINYIEFILDYNDFQENPLTFDAGVNEILEIIGQAKERNYTVLTTEKDFFRIKNFEFSEITSCKINLVISEKLKLMSLIKKLYD